MTKGEALKYAIAFALRRSRKIIRGLKEGLTEEERYAKPDPVTSWCGGGGMQTGSGAELGWGNRAARGFGGRGAARRA
jgi:hypothetical protein